MIILGVDTSTAFLTISLINEKRILADYNSAAKLRHSAILIPTLQKLLKKVNIKISDIDLFSVGIGPGSFTGLRVGITAIRALAIALNRAIIGVPTMDAIAHNGFTYLKRTKQLERFTRVCPLLDAKKSRVYACIYSHTGTKIIRETGYLLEPIENLLKHLKGSVLFLGDAISLYKERLLYKKTFKAQFLDERIWLPKASVIAKIAFKRYQEGRTDNPYDLTPLYLYPRECQVRYV